MTLPKYASPLAFRQALDARLRNDATAGRTTIERLRQLLVFDRFLARVGQHLGARVIVKGGVVMELRLEHARTTRDVDLKWTGPSSDVIGELRAAAEIDLGDFLAFEVAPHREHPTLRAEGMRYDGFRFGVVGSLGGKAYGLPFGVDVAIGDPLVEEPELLDGVDTLDFLDLPRVRHRVYPRTSHIAEKLHAYTLPRTRENSRVKDLPDIALLASTGAFNAAPLRAAIAATFSVRAVQPAPERMPAPPPSWSGPYARMAKNDALPWADIDAVFAAATAFLDPILAGAEGTWSAESWAWLPSA